MLVMYSKMQQEFYCPETSHRISFYYDEKLCLKKSLLDIKIKIIQEKNLILHLLL